MVRIDIGCSFHKLKGWIGVDLEPGVDVDIIADMSSLPFHDSSIDRIHTRHTLEHVKEPLKCVSELYRVSKAGGLITIIVPHYSNPAYWADMTHLRPFSARSFEYYDLDLARRAGFPIYLPHVNLKARKIRLSYWPSRIYLDKPLFKRTLLRVLDGIFSGLGNWNPFLCERFWCGWVGGFYEVTFELEAIKG